MRTGRLNGCQQQLQRIYDVAVPHNVEDYVTTNAELARHVDTSKGAREVVEKLLVVQQDDCIELALYLDEGIVERLKNMNAADGLDRTNLTDFWVAVEGVSHFLYLTYNAGFERGVSLLELELQAEVDRYVTTAILFGRQDSGRIPTNLHEWLFEDPSFEEGLDPEALNRYKLANHYAGLYCRHLQDHYLKNRANSGMMNELRRFYRLTQRQKIDRIESARPN